MASNVRKRRPGRLVRGVNFHEHEGLPKLAWKVITNVFNTQYVTRICSCVISCMKISVRPQSSSLVECAPQPLAVRTLVRNTLIATKSTNGCTQSSLPGCANSERQFSLLSEVLMHPNGSLSISNRFFVSIAQGCQPASRPNKKHASLNLRLPKMKFLHRF
jgi:hypothetical protein